jgi:hypothetical protein
MTMRCRINIQSLLLACAMLLPAAVQADPPARPKEGFGVYIIALRNANGEGNGKGEKLDVRKFDRSPRLQRQGDDPNVARRRAANSAARSDRQGPCLRT